MYLPYLRGKQFELIALNEIGEVMSKKKDKVSPIIEPVKDSSTFRKSLRNLADRNINFNVIINPKVGDLVDSTDIILEILIKDLSGYSNYQIGIIIDESWSLDYIEKIQKTAIKFNGFTLVHNIVSPKPLDVVSTHTKYFPVVTNVVNFSRTNRRYFRNFEVNTVVSLEDFFNAQDKNADYLSIKDSPFSEEHLFFKGEKMKGFSDFLTIGDNYSETGFLPYAVAIHLSYDDPEKKIRVKHFVSDSNDDTSDVAGKFAEALKKLIKWCDESKKDTMAIREFRHLHETGHFPGLGSIKKLSIMHHIELVLTLI